MNNKLLLLVTMHISFFSIAASDDIICEQPTKKAISCLANNKDLVVGCVCCCAASYAPAIGHFSALQVSKTLVCIGTMSCTGRLLDLLDQIPHRERVGTQDRKFHRQ